MRIWIDTDLGTDVDDALALAYAIRHPGIDLVGVSTVFGDVALRTRMVEALLEVAGQPPLPVVTGLGKPLTPGRDGLMFGHEGQGLIPDARPQARITEDPDSAERVTAIATAIEAARPDVLLAIGPLSNVGALAAAGARLPRLAIMGGKLADVMLPGMSEKVSEWNWYCDPLAVQRVLAAPHGVPPRVVPAEVTFLTALADGDVDRLAAGDDLAQALAVLSRIWLDTQRDPLGVARPRVALHDPLTLATLFEAGLCAFATRHIQVDDRARARLGSGAAVEAATDVDTEATRRHLMEVLLS